MNEDMFLLLCAFAIITLGLSLCSLVADYIMPRIEANMKRKAAHTRPVPHRQRNEFAYICHSRTPAKRNDDTFDVSVA